MVNIYGEEYPITGVTDPAHISKVADFVDRRMNEAAGSSRVKSRDKVAILVAMSIASELLETTGELETASDGVMEQVDALLARLDHELPHLSEKT